MNRTLFALAALAASSFAIAPAAQAATLTLFNTGVDASGTPLPDGTIGDPHYTLVSVPGGTTDIRVRTSAGGYPIPPYLADDTLSAWIGPNNDSQVDGPVGAYDYQTSFTISGNASTASITGQWATDNEGVAILVNGVATGLTNTAQFTSWTPFTISSGFHTGVNTLDFIVNNDGGPTALRVEMSGAVMAVPEPAAWALMLVGLGGLGVSLRRRRAVIA